MKFTTYLALIAAGSLSFLAIAHENDATSTNVNGTEVHDHSAHDHDHDHDADHEEHADHDHGHDADTHADHDHADHDEDHDHDHDGHTHSQATSVLITPEARQSLDMQVEPLVARPFDNCRSYYGQFEYPPHAVTTYALPTSGRVNVRVKSADTVKKGDVLYTLESPALAELTGNATTAQAKLQQAEAELATLRARQERLVGIGTRNVELDSSIKFKEAEMNVIKAEADNTRIQLLAATGGAEAQGATLNVTADGDGQVQSVSMNRNAWGEQGNTVLTLTDRKGLEFRARANSTDALSGRQVQLKVNTPDGTRSLTLPGQVRFADQIDATTKTRDLYFVPDQLPEWAFAGQSGLIQLSDETADEQEYLPIPNSAVVKVGVNDVVFIQDPANENLFHMKQVQSLHSRRGFTPVKGLQPGQLVVTRGGYELKYKLPDESGSKKAAGHFHADGKFHEGED